MNILVTGGTGFIGSHICRELVRLGHYVFVLRHLSPTGQLGELKGIEFIHGDIRDKNCLNELRYMMKENDITTVFHQAALWRGNTLQDLYRCNVQGTYNILDIAKTYGVTRFIYASTVSVYTTPPIYILPVIEIDPTYPYDSYGATKLSGELICSNFADDIDVTILRYGAVYGPGQCDDGVMQRFVMAALENRPISFDGDGKQSTDFVYINDLVRANILAMERDKPGVYNISSGKETSILQLAQKVVELTGSKSAITSSGRKSNRPFTFYMSVKKAGRELDYQPKYTLEEGLAEYISELKVENNAIH